MSKRSQPRSLGSDSADSASPFDTLEQLTALGYEGIAKDLSKGSGVVRAVPTDIFAIYPDPAQPRRAVPSEFRDGWDGDPQTLIEQIFEPWFQRVGEERGAAFELDTYLGGNPNSQSPESENDSLPGPLEASLLAVINLAGSIYRDGLLNAITIVQRGDQYQLETGERRWLAYHLLYAHTQDEQWSKIPARTVEQINVWRQASENNARADLNAIGKARQLALLLIDLLKREKNEEFAPFTQFENERAYYAQVLNRPTVYGRNDLLLNALGVTHRSAISRYKKLLELPDEVWLIGDDYNLPEETLVKLSDMNPQDAIQSVHQIVAGRNNSDNPSSRISAVADYAPGTKRYFAEFSRLINRARPGKEEINREALRRVQEMKTWLEEQERRISALLD